MKLIVVILSLVAVATANDRTRCNTGTRVTVEGFTAFDNSFASYCGEDQPFCTRYTYEQSIVNDGIGYNLLGEYGECSSTEVTDCSSILPFLEPIGTVLNCSSSSCASSGDEPCNEFVFSPAATDCSVPENDVRVFPGCTLRDSLKEAFDCVAPFLYSFPHNDAESCDNQLDDVLQCLGKIVTKCVDSNCPSALDDLSDFRSRFSEVSFWAATIKSSHQLVEVVRNYTGGLVDLDFVFESHICRVNRSEVESTINLLENNSFDIDQLIATLFPTFNCPTAFSQLQQSGFQFLRAFYDSDNSENTYQVFVDDIARIQAIFNGCNLEVIQETLPEILSFVNVTVDAEQIRTGLGIVWEYSTYLPPTETPVTPNPEGCPAEAEGYEYGVVDLGCDRYHNITSRCGRRKSWTCHFAEWRLNFLRTWLSEFYKRHGDEDIPTPECGNDRDFLKCKESDICCYNAPRGCRLCYCTEHDYDHSYNDILGSWRHSYNEWNQFFRSWQNLNREDRCF